MQSNLTYFIVVVGMALAVIITCGAGITWNCFSARRWGEKQPHRSRRREQPATDDDGPTSANLQVPSTDRENQKLAA